MTGAFGGVRPDASGAGGAEAGWPDLTCDGFLDGRVRMWQPRHGYRAAVDPVLLAAFVPARAGQRVLDLGCGAGTASLCLAVRVPGLRLAGLEVQPEYAALARRNAAENGVALEVVEGDLRRMPPPLRAATFDHVMANPPYLPAGSMAATDAGRDRANREGEAGLGDWIDAGLRRLAVGGWLVVVHRADRLGDLLSGLAGRAGAVEVVPVAARRGAAAGRVLVRARKGRGGALRLWEALTLHGDGPAGAVPAVYTSRAQRILRGAGELVPDAGDG